MNKKQIAAFIQALVLEVVAKTGVTETEARTMVGLELRGVRRDVFEAALVKCGCEFDDSDAPAADEVEADEVEADETEDATVSG